MKQGLTPLHGHATPNSRTGACATVSLSSNTVAATLIPSCGSSRRRTPERAGKREIEFLPRIDRSLGGGCEIRTYDVRRTDDGRDTDRADRRFTFVSKRQDQHALSTAGVRICG